MLRPSLAVLAFVAAVAFSRCGGGSRTAAGTPRATVTPSASPQGGIDTMAGASTRPVHVPATNRRVAPLTDVRAARPEGSDRVVFEFRDALAGHDVRYRSPATTSSDPDGERARRRPQSGGGAPDL